MGGQMYANVLGLCSHIPELHPKAQGNPISNSTEKGAHTVQTVFDGTFKKERVLNGGKSGSERWVCVWSMAQHPKDTADPNTRPCAIGYVSVYRVTLERYTTQTH